MFRSFLALCTMALPSFYAPGKWIGLPPIPAPHREVVGQAANGKIDMFAGLVSAPMWLPAEIV